MFRLLSLTFPVEAPQIYVKACLAHKLINAKNFEIK